MTSQLNFVLPVERPVVPRALVELPLLPFAPQRDEPSLLGVIPLRWERGRTIFNDITTVPLADLCGGWLELGAFRSKSRRGLLDGAAMFDTGQAGRGAMRVLHPGPYRRASFGLRLGFRLGAS